MRLYWKKESHEAWDHFKRSGARNAQTGEAMYPESDAFMRDFHERHIPISEQTLKCWNKEADICGSTYGISLKADIKWARKCNDRKDELLIFNDSTGVLPEEK